MPLTDWIAVLVAASVGLLAGVLVDRLAGAFPWPDPRRSWRPGAGTLTADGVSRSGLHDRGDTRLAVRRPVLVGTALLCGLTALRFGASWQLPAFLYLACAGVLLTAIDLRHHLLPNRVVVPSYGVAAALLLLAAAATGEWDALGRAGGGGAALFAGFLVLALISPSGLGMGDVKLAGLLGLYLGWLGWTPLLLGAAAGFVVQALLALALLVARRVDRRAELPFGPAMLGGAALVIGWSGSLV